MWKLHEIQIFVSINKYATLIYLCIVHNCFCSVAAELRGCYKDCMAHNPQIITIRPFIGKKKVCPHTLEVDDLLF